MQIQVNTDNNIQAREMLAERVEENLRTALERFSERITRVEVHLGDVNSGAKAGVDDKRCLLEARLAGREPIAVSHNAATLREALDGALGQLKRSLDSVVGKMEDRRSH